MRKNVGTPKISNHKKDELNLRKLKRKEKEFSKGRRQIRRKWQKKASGSTETAKEGAKYQ